MNRGNLRSLVRFYIPSAKKSRISDTLVNLVIQEAVNFIATELFPILENKKFDAEDGVYEYDTKTIVDRFLGIAPSGLWWNSGSADSPAWIEVLPKTLKWLDENMADWRDLDESDPQYYAQDGDNLIIVPTPDTDLTNGFWLWFGQKPTDMASDDSYPWDSSNNRLSFLSHTIMKYVEWRISPGLKQKQISILSGQEFRAELEKARKLLARRLDISAHRKTRLQGRRI